jgi:probable rRNA maturation factor
MGLRRSARTILGALGCLDADLSVTLTDDAGIAELSARFGLGDHATDVLAFPQREGPGAEHAGGLLGDVVISLDTAQRQAAARRASLDDELRVLLIHGVLHLLGMDHARSRDALAMQALEAHLLALTSAQL